GVRSRQSFPSLRKVSWNKASTSCWKVPCSLASSSKSLRSSARRPECTKNLNGQAANCSMRLTEVFSTGPYSCAARSGGSPDSLPCNPNREIRSTSCPSPGIEDVDELVNFSSSSAPFESPCNSAETNSLDCSAVVQSGLCGATSTGKSGNNSRIREMAEDGLSGAPAASCEAQVNRSLRCARVQAI